MNRALDVSSDISTTPLDASVVVEGVPATGSRALAAVAGVEIGVWEMTPGTATDVEADEVFIVLQGSASVSFHDGEVIDLTPGMVVRLRAGDRTTWVVHETLRKLYVG